MRKKSILFLITCTMLFVITSISYAEVNQSDVNDDVKENIENYENNTENKEVKDDENVDLNNEQNDIEEKNATKQEDENIINKDNVEEKDNVVNEIEKKDTNINGLVLENGIYFYYENGVKNTNYTGLYVQDNIKWYVISGKVDFSYTGKYTDSENIYYIENNKVSNDTKLVYLDDWRMVVDGKIIYDYTGIGKNGNGYWYLEKGNISYTYNGEYFDGNKTYLIKENKVYGIIEKNTTCLMEINGIWRMVVDGKIVYDYTGIGKNGNGYWYLEKGNISYTYNGEYFDGNKTYLIKGNRVYGIIEENTTCLMEINGIWRMVVDGKIVYDYTGIGKNGNGYWYLEKGNISYTYNGEYNDGEKVYLIKGNRVYGIIEKNTTCLMEINGIWRMVVDGKIVYDYTGIGKNGNGYWYLEKGNISYTYNGEYNDGEKVYLIKGNRVYGIIEKNTTCLMEINGIWRMVVDGKIIYDYTGIGKNGNGYWYLEKGNISYTYNGEYNDGEKTYLIKGNRVYGIIEKNTTCLMEINGIWRMVVDGKIIYDYTGIGKNGNGYWYLEKGNISYTYNGEYNDGEKIYLIKGNRVYGIIEKNTTCLMEINGIWRMVVDGKIVYDYTGIGKNGNGYWYLEKGNISYTYNGEYNDGEKTYLIKGNRVYGIIEKNTTCLMEINGIWRMVVDGKIVYDYTGIGKNGNGYWYLEKGNISYTYNGEYNDGEKIYLIKGNRVYGIIEKNTTCLMEINGIWRMVVDGKIVYDYTGIGKNGNGYWYLEKGNISYTYNGEYNDGEKTYLIKGNRVYGIIEKNTTCLMEINGIWRMVVDGKIVYDYTGIGKNGNGYWYLEKGNISYKYNGEYFDGNKTYLIKGNRVYGIIEKNITCLMEINGIWRMVVDGKIVYDYTGIGKNGNGYWYLEKGNISYTYNGIYNDGVDDYVIENSRVVGTKLMEINGTWRMVVDGKIVYDYTGIGKNGNGYWYLEKGEISYKYNGTWYDENENAFIIENNRVQAIVKKDTTGLIVIDKEWRMVKNGVVDYNYTGIGEKNNEKWYLENGKITYTYNGEYKEEDGIVYTVINSLVSGIISRPGFESTMVVEQPERLNKYISDSLIVSGWALSSNKNDKILIYVDGIYCGEASRRNRDDILEKYINGEYGGTECNLQPGFYFDLSIKRLSVGTHIVTIVNIADDGETIIQSRDVLINITALTKSWGIDVSEHQGKINWDAVKNSGVTFAILRVGYYLESSGRTVIDKYFYENYEACKRLGIAVGGYFYSYAFNGTEGEHEANSCLSVIKGKVFELPIFIDVEDRIIKNAVADGRTTVENVTNASVSFCDKLINAGYQAGVYASRNFFYDYFNIPLIEKYSIWVAHYTDNQTDYNRKYDFWQSSSNGSVPGINGRVDMDWFYQK